MTEALVKIRDLQGWGQQSVDDFRLRASFWKEQLDSVNIRPELYSTLIDMAIKHQATEILQGKQPTQIIPALLIACYQKYRALKLEELARTNSQIDYYRSIRHQYQKKEITLEKAARQMKFQEDITEEDFLRVSDEVITNGERKSESFMEDNLL